ncbi:competence protein CoiA [Phaeovulum vinaykumarii]|uniref:Competence protein CoiA n=1 Tax=Phaeovulum vinaykumarii TaxID=407234 RepID=A0A1N7K616_9RHOB|nr:competence protein CoiA family protein [Phaeovulum vinaykumarii]SIS56990.1 competence protein CoiA [Phaeovulum vinaykumarii]SOB93231.1 competence protein CoiA-like protein [Phaeovulum vinaykumarii]
MLVADCEGKRIDAFTAQKGPTYSCPECRGEVVLKKGRKVVHHFAHKPPTTCTWATGETRAHMEAKAIVADALKTRGLRVELEYVVNTLPGDRRADVMAWSPNGQLIAFELQHTPIGIDEIERRASSYASANIAQIWIPFLSPKVWDEGYPHNGGWFVQRYTPRSFERWVHGLNGKNGMWMYDPKEQEFWLGRLASHQQYINETSWFSEGGEENFAGGYYKYSKRFRELTLNGPHKATDLRIAVSTRKAFSTAGYNWPAARIANLTLA